MEKEKTVYTKEDYKNARDLHKQFLKDKYDVHTIKVEMIRQYKRGTKILNQRNQQRPLITKKATSDTYYLHPNGLEAFKKCLENSKKETR